MATLPQLIEEDIQRLDAMLRALLERTEATTAMVIDRGGFLITQQDSSQQFDLTTIAALASGAFMANKTIANLVHETNFSSVYQQGEKFSMYITSIDEHCLLVVIFEAQLSLGAVKYFAAPTAEKIAAQLHIAYERAPGEGLDLSVFNIANTENIFRKKAAGGGDN